MSRARSRRRPRLRKSMLPNLRQWWSTSLIGVFLGLCAWMLVDRPALHADALAEPLAQTSRPNAVRVIDGDTFDYRGERIRIVDIDTPELRGRCPAETALARRATDRMRALLAAGPFELQRLGRDEDRYGRKLRIVTRHGRSLGDQLVREGLARTWTGRREPWC